MEKKVKSQGPILCMYVHTYVHICTYIHMYRYVYSILYPLPQSKYLMWGCALVLLEGELKVWLKVIYNYGK
jgi:hypothetical protein